VGENKQTKPKNPTQCKILQKVKVKVIYKVSSKRIHVHMYLFSNRFNSLTLLQSSTKVCVPNCSHFGTHIASALYVGHRGKGMLAAETSLHLLGSS